MNALSNIPEYSWHLHHKLNLIGRVRHMGLDTAARYSIGWEYEFIMSLEDCSDDDLFWIWKTINAEMQLPDPEETCPFWPKAKAEAQRGVYQTFIV